MIIAIIVLTIAIVAATQWMRLMERRVEALNARIAYLERKVDQQAGLR